MAFSPFTSSNGAGRVFRADLWHSGGVRALVLLAAVCSLPGCGDSDLFLGIPFVEGDEAAIIALEGEDGLAVFARSVGADDRIEHQLDLGADAGSATVLFYSAPLAALGVEAGRLQDDPAGMLLPDFDHAARALIDGAGVGDWTPIERLEPDLATFRVPAVTRCRNLVSRMAEDVDEEGWYGSALTRIDDGRALLLSAKSGGSERRLYEVSANGAVERLSLDLPDFRIDAVSTSRDGRLVLAGLTTAEVQIRIGRLETGFEVASRRPLRGIRDEPDKIAVASDDEPEGTVYALTRYSSVMRFEPGRAGEVLVEGGSYGNDGAIAPLDRRTLLFSPQSGASIMRYAGGVVEREPTEVDRRLDNLEEEVWTIYAGSTPALAATNRGTVLQRRAGAWAVVGSTALEVTARVLVPFGDGVLIGGGLGLVQQYEPGVGLCQELLLGRGYVVQGLVPLGDVILVAGYREVTDVRFIPFVAVVEIR